ncbi:hypothetical protein [Maricaulis sp.]|uniref:hypothetical protein n=1 Tax=Maricaulis sp. TaxID=1486257 RepID=UPI00260588E5|nr:hypothetical protein [Maricaulis sp.]
MSVQIGPVGAAQITPVTFSGHLVKAQLSTCIHELAARLAESGRYLVDFRGCAIDASIGEFMGLIEHWFESLGTNTPMAVLMDGQAQGDYAMLFDTKSFLLGSRLKTFTCPDEASDWLAKGISPTAAL